MNPPTGRSSGASPPMTGPTRLLVWGVSSLVFSLIPIAIPILTAGQHTGNTVSLYRVISTGELYVVCAGLAGATVVQTGLAFRQRGWFVAKLIVLGTAAVIIYMSSSLFTDLKTSTQGVNMGSVGHDSLILLVLSVATGASAVLLAEA